MLSSSSADKAVDISLKWSQTGKGPLSSFQQTTTHGPQTEGHAELRGGVGRWRTVWIWGLNIWDFLCRRSNVLTDGFPIVFQGGLQKTLAAGGRKQTRDLTAKEWQNTKKSKERLTFFFAGYIRQTVRLFLNMVHVIQNLKIQTYLLLWLWQMLSCKATYKNEENNKVI